LERGKIALVKDRSAGAVSIILRLAFFISLSCCTASSAFCQPSPEGSYYSRLNSFGILGAYSNDSSHILLGYAEKRKLLTFGVSYSRRLLFNHAVIWQYNGELLPVALESDPLTRFVSVQTSPTTATYTGNLPYSPVTCSPVVTSYSNTINGTTYSGTETYYCSGRHWTIGEGMSPVGMQWNFLPQRKAQPFVIGHGGYMYSTQPIPISGAGSFNFTFDLGAGIELYRSQTRSIRAEYRYHHISNHGTAYQNPGIDSGVFQLTYAFGR
jgi:opacity protein-like surface antigen